MNDDDKLHSELQAGQMYGSPIGPPLPPEPPLAEPTTLSEFPEWARRIGGIKPERYRELLAYYGMSDEPTADARDRAIRIIDKADDLGITAIVSRPLELITRASLWNVIDKLIVAAIGSNIITKPRNFPADHYAGKYGIKPGTLLKAHSEGRLIGAKKENGRWHYPECEVRRLYPDAFENDGT